MRKTLTALLLTALVVLPGCVFAIGEEAWDDDGPHTSRMAKLEKLLAGADVRVPKNEVLPRGKYIQLQADLMLLAFQMGITNIATFMIGPERWEATLR